MSHFVWFRLEREAHHTRPLREMPARKYRLLCLGVIDEESRERILQIEDPGKPS
jgi:hypothetical protein